MGKWIIATVMGAVMALTIARPALAHEEHWGPEMQGDPRAGHVDVPQPDNFIIIDDRALTVTGMKRLLDTISIPAICKTGFSTGQAFHPFGVGQPPVAVTHARNIAILVYCPRAAGSYAIFTTYVISGGQLWFVDEVKRKFGFTTGPVF